MCERVSVRVRCEEERRERRDAPTMYMTSTRPMMSAMTTLHATPVTNIGSMRTIVNIGDSCT